MELALCHILSAQNSLRSAWVFEKFVHLCSKLGIRYKYVVTFG